MIMELSFKSDEDGFISRECRACERVFKICLSASKGAAFRYCPYCGVEGRNWSTSRQKNFAKKAGRDRFQSELTAVLQRALRGSILQLKPKSPVVKRSIERTARLEDNSNWPELSFPSGFRIKHDGTQMEFFCPVTGVRTPF